MMICLTGAGGKTALLYALAEEAAAEGKNVIVSTTTHILQPEDHYAGGLQEVRSLWRSGSYAVVGTPCEEGKLKMLPGAELDFWDKEADLLLLEADGAKGYPVKVPAAHEPVIPAQCAMVIGVMGMDALGKPLKDACFRLEEAMALLNCTDDHVVTKDDLVHIALSPEGLAKGSQGREYCIVLNKCDLNMAAAEEMRTAIAAQSSVQVTLTSWGKPVSGENNGSVL
jgi:probable selenium-dependent hydroxylase accessory protein YqeC